ncbi:OLC1v1005403C1 [Oldenlandia corymbosa var. corymbosa]|uniref:OLC1v1005403C1 n=1 Tax=Oldenlandia corymbosa var. corymbosa TaxID=529605 RepID=A0AAV1DGI7_OLDCO|nr:OLC1v1005403C1 [Oldenlandia corymbosa var. corymbosa]
MATDMSFHSQLVLSVLLLSMAVSLPISHAQQTPSYMKFVLNATDMPPEDYYDYIIVGGGTAGCPLAATLSGKYRVLVLERGGVPHTHPNLMTQEGFLPTLLDSNSPVSPAQTFISEDGVHNARGRVLGGSSAINAGFYSRADAEFFRASGMHWDLRVVNKSYEWVEKAIVFRPELKNWQSAVRDGFLEAGIGPYNGFALDHVEGTKIGGTIFDANGQRHSAADLLGYYANPNNITVAVYATVQRVLVAAFPLVVPKAIGVVFRDQLGQFHHAMLREKGEIFLSAGAIGTPQLLLLSGIGPRPYLSSWGIPVVHHHPYVGQFLYDNPRNGISFVPSVPLEHSLIQVVGITSSGAYLEAASNVVPFLATAHGFLGRNPGSPAGSLPVYFTVATLIEKIVGPLSAGSLRLASTDVRVNPIVRFNYFSNQADVEKCVNGTRKIADVLNSRSMDDFKSFHLLFGSRDFRYVGPALPADVSNDAVMQDFCRQTVNTIWHYHGGCLVGKVVDRNLRVMGIESLRVVDGSILTVSPGTNPQATLLMLGRYVGLKVLRDRMRPKVI